MERVYRPSPNESITRLGRFEFDATRIFKVNTLQLLRVQGVQSEIRSLWADLSVQPSGMRVFAPSTGAHERWPAGSIGWGSLWAVDDCQLEVSVNRSIVVELMASSAIIPSYIHDAGVLHPLAMDQSTHVSVAASNTAVQILGPNNNSMGENELRSTARCAYAIRNASDAVLYVLEDDDTTPPVSATKHTYALSPGAQEFRNTPYNSEVHAVNGVAAVGSWQVTAYYRELVS